MLLALLLFAAIPQDGLVVREDVDLIERNHFSNDEGREVFTQWVFWRWEAGRHEVAAWRLDKPEMSFDQRQLRLTWPDGPTLRQVRGGYFRETRTQYDVEMVERERLPATMRKGLGR